MFFSGLALLIISISQSTPFHVFVRAADQACHLSHKIQPPDHRCLQSRIAILNRKMTMTSVTQTMPNCMPSSTACSHQGKLKAGAATAASMARRSFI
jgi:hypothetical protein